MTVRIALSFLCCAMIGATSCRVGYESLAQNAGQRDGVAGWAGSSGNAGREVTSSDPLVTAGWSARPLNAAGHTAVGASGIGGSGVVGQAGSGVGSFAGNTVYPQGGTQGSAIAGNSAFGGALGGSNWGGSSTLVTSSGGTAGSGDSASSAGVKAAGATANNTTPAGGVVNSDGTAGAGGTTAGLGVGGATAASGTAGANGSGGNAGTSAFPGGRCDWSQGPPPFGAAFALGAPNDPNQPDIDPVLSHDGLTLYFVSYRDNKQGNDIYYSTRSSLTASFGPGNALKAANSTASETHFFVSASGTESWVASDRSSAGRSQIYSATWSSTLNAWGTFAAVTSINTDGGSFDPHLEADGLTLWFDPIDRTGGSANQDIFFARRSNLAAPLGSPVPCTALNTLANEWNVSLTDDGRVVVFQSDRDGMARIYYAIRASRTAEFGAPIAIPYFDKFVPSLSDPFVSPDGCSIYFAALVSPSTSMDLYVAEALPP